MYVLDAWAVVAWLADESPAADQVENLLEEGNQLRIHRNNVVEVLYLALRRSEERASEVAEALGALPVRIVETSDALMWRAARIKADHGFGFADAFAAATAIETDSVLVTGDRDFAELDELADLEVEWVGTD